MAATLALVDSETMITESAMSFRMDEVVDRYAYEEGLSKDIAQRHEQELKRYLILCALYPEYNLGMPKTVDPLWHHFICFTRLYHCFCQQVAGRYIHHNPATEAERLNGKTRESYFHAIELYRNHFGEPPSDLWPVPTASDASLCSACGAGCGSDCNAG